MKAGMNSILSRSPGFSGEAYETFNSLPLKSQLEVLLQARGKGRLDYILLSEKPEEVVRALPELEIFLTIQEVGKEDALELLTLTTPEQFQYLVDLEVWKKDRLVPEKLLEWVEILMECGEEKFAQFLRSADLEFIILILKKFIRVTKQEEENSEKDGRPTPESLERLYFVHVKEEKARPLINRFLEKLLYLDMELYRRVMEGVIWELESGLEETEYRWRNGRLADLGFPDFEEALEIYRFINPQTMRLDGKTLFSGELGEPGLVPAFYLTFQEDGPFFSTALRRLDDPSEQDRIKAEIAALGNKAIIAESTGGFSQEEIERVGRKVFHYLNLGLQFLSTEKKAEPVDVLRSVSIQRVFQCGFSNTLLLKRKAEVIFEGPWFERNRGNLVFLDFPHREIFKGLLQKRPAFYRNGKYDDFKHVDDFREIESILEMITASTHFIIDHLGLSSQKLKEMDWRNCHPNRWQEITLSTILLTSLGNQILKNIFLFEAIERNQLPILLSCLFERVDESRQIVKREVRDRVNQSFMSITKEGGKRLSMMSFWDFCFGILEQEYGRIPPGERIDLRFFKGFLIRRG